MFDDIDRICLFLSASHRSLMGLEVDRLLKFVSQLVLIVGIVVAMVLVYMH